MEVETFQKDLIWYYHAGAPSMAGEVITKRKGVVHLRFHPLLDVLHILSSPFYVAYIQRIVRMPRERPLERKLHHALHVSTLLFPSQLWAAGVGLANYSDSERNEGLLHLGLLARTSASVVYTDYQMAANSKQQNIGGDWRHGDMSLAIMLAPHAPDSSFDYDEECCKKWCSDGLARKTVLEEWILQNKI